MRPQLSTLEVNRAKFNSAIDDERAGLIEQKEKLMKNAKRLEKDNALDAIRQEIYKMPTMTDTELLAACRAKGLDAKWLELTGEQLSVAIERMRTPPYTL